MRRPSRIGNFLSGFSGFSIPWFGLQWQPSKSELTTAKSLINFLEDRRVLFDPWDWERPQYCAQSVVEIRHFLTSTMDGLNEKSELRARLDTMRVACRAFLAPENPGHAVQPADSFMTREKLDVLREVFGLCIKDISEACNIKVGSDLATIIPSTAT